MIKALLALVTAALFAGAALYVTLVEHAARMRIDEGSALAEWKVSARRAAPMMASLALVSLILGAWAWWKIGDGWLLAAALLIGANIPLTLILILPTNRRLEAAGGDGANIGALLGKWGRLHALRTGLGLAAVVLYLVAFWRP